MKNPDSQEDHLTMSKKKLSLRRSTVRRLSGVELDTVRGGDDVQHVTRAFTDCQYCGNTNAPGPCRETYQGCPSHDEPCDESMDPEIDPHCSLRASCDIC